MPIRRIPKKVKEPFNRSVMPVDRASIAPSGRGQSGGVAGTEWNDNPDRMTGMPPKHNIAARGGPSTSPDVNASEIMQNMIMNDDDKQWYKELFAKQAKNFLKPRSTVHNGSDVGLNCSVDARSTIDVTEGWKSTVGHVMLDVAGLIPGVGELADVTNALWYAKEGKYLYAALSLISIIPALGDIIGKGSKLAIALDKTGRAVKQAKLFIKANRRIIDAVLRAAGKNERLKSYVPRIKEALNAFSGHSNIRESHMHCLGCASNLCRRHVVSEARKNLLTEPDNVKDKEKNKKKKSKKESNAAGSGSIRGSMANDQTLAARKKNAKVNARSFGGGQVIGEY